MNKIYRIIWNKARKCLMVVAENAKSCGVGSGRKASVVNAVAAVLLSLQGVGAQAQTSYVVNTPTYTPVNLSTPGDSLEVDFSGSIITGSSAAVVSFGNPNVAFISNSGTIAAADTNIFGPPATGIILFSGTITNGINNAGRIDASGAGILAFSTQIMGITNSGVINGTDKVGISLAGSTVNGGITNLSGGTISGPSGNAIYIDGSSQITSIVNEGGYINGINNAGTIFGPNYGLLVSSGGLIESGITNTGSVGGSVTGIRLVSAQVSGGVINSGVIYGSDNGIIIASGSTVSGGIFNAGTINAHLGGATDSRLGAINIRSSQVLGGITNSGLIELSNQGIILENSTLVGGINNSGTIISGTWAGIALRVSTVAGGIVNSGSITGWLGIEVRDSLLSGGITNSGTVTSSSTPGISVRGSTIYGGIHNAGHLIGDQSGLFVSSLIDTGPFTGIIKDTAIYGGVTNSGIISGSSAGIQLISNVTISGGLTNSGVISGNRSIDISPDSSLDRIVIAGRNTAVFDGAVYAPNTPVTIAGGSGYIMGTNFTVSGFNNLGILTVDPGFTPSITGDSSPASYIQSIGGVYRTSVTGVAPGSFGSLYVDGSATFAPGASIDIRLSGSGTGVSAGSEINGIFVANDGITNDGTLTLTDNSVLLDFTINISGNQLDVTAVTATACAGTVSSDSAAGPCLVGFDSPSLQVDSGATITSATSGVQVLAGLSDAASIPLPGVNNQGVVTGNQYGVQLLSGATLTGGITNAGIIAGGNVGIIINSASLVGGITNTSGSSISGALGQGIVIDAYSTVDFISNDGGFISGIHNAGTISGGLFGIKVSESNINGGIVNSGSIFGSDNALHVGLGSTIAGGILNSGVMRGSYARSAYSLGAIKVSQSLVIGGVVNTGLIELSNQGIFIDESTVSGGINNSGTIISDTYGGITVDSSQIYGGVVNQGSIYGYTGINLNDSRVYGGLTNSGSITAFNAPGVVISSSSIYGGLKNSGYIHGDEIGISIEPNTLIAGGITNSGTVIGQNEIGVDIRGNFFRPSAPTIVERVIISGGFLNSGLIIGGSSGIRISSLSTISGGLNNSGTIIGEAQYGIAIVGSEISNGLINSGSIGGSIYIAGRINVDPDDNVFSHDAIVSGGMVNSGTINGSGMGAASINISGSLQTSGPSATAFALISGGLTNSGLIYGGSTGIRLTTYATISGGLVNSGSIAGGSAGISINRSSLLSGGINNSGLISSSSGAGISLNSSGTISGGLTNSGVIAGFNNSIYVSPDSSLDRIVIAGRNTAVFDGAVYAPNTPVTIAGGSSYTIGTDFIVNSFHNQGILTTDPSFDPSITGDLFAPSVASYSQSADGIYRTSVTGVVPGSFGSLYVDGTATFSSGSGIDIRLSGLGAGVTVGTSIDGIFVANGGINNSGTFSVTDNSVLLDFTANISGGDQLNIAAVSSGACSGVVPSSTTGPCLVGFDSPTLQVDSGATIASATSGVQVLAGLSDAGGSPNALDIEGVIRGAQYGVQFLSGSTLIGSIQNDGIISGASAGVILNSATLLGGITNNPGASISGGSGRGIVIDAYSSVDFIANDRGYISGITNAGSIGAISNFNGTIAGGIFNVGTIASSSSGGIFNGNFATITGGAVNRGYISNSGNGISIYGNSLVQHGITNSGTISTSYIGSSRSAIAGISIDVNSYVTGGIINSGLIETNDQGILVSDSNVYGGIFNSGTISAGGTAGIKIESSYLAGGIVNSGSITGSNGIQIRNADLTSGVISSGTIIGVQGSGIAIQNSNIYSGIENAGFISATDAGVKLSGGYISSGFTNSGTINAIDIGVKILNEGVLSGGLRNSGSIRGSVAGLAIASSAYIYGGLTNSGVIQGGSIGLSLSSYSVIENGITNSGLIAGSSTGIKLSSSSQIYGGLTNSGVISGSNYSVNVSPGAYLSQIVIAGRNTAEFNGEVYAPNAAVTISGGSSFLLGSNFVVQGFSNEGILSVDSNQYSITGNGSSSSYLQSSSGIYRTNVNYLPMNDYGSMYVDGTATFASGSGIDVRLSGPGTGVTVGTSINGILFAADGITNSGTFSVTDNSVLLDFNANINGNELDVIAVSSDACAGTVSGDTSGPCLVGFDSPSLQVNSGVTISSTTSGVQVLAGYSNNYSTNFGVNNQGSIIGTQYGVQMLSGSTLVGGITNSGKVVGGDAGIILNSATLLGGIQNNVGASISGGVGRGIVIDAYSSVAGITNNGGYIGGIANAGNIIATENAIVVTNEGTNAGENIGIISGDIQNSGTIIGEQGIGIFLQSASLAGSIQNSGSIAGAGFGMVSTGSTIVGGLTNSGTISSALGDFYNAAISIFDSSLSGGIANFGQINASENSIIMFYSQIDGGINNSGIINGAGKVGLAILNSSISGGINNSGSIIGNGEHGIAISGSLIRDGITNSGNIVGLGDGLNMLAYANIDSDGVDYSHNSSISGGLFNSGTIIGSSAVGVNLAGDYATSGAYNTTAVALISGGLTNSGLILGANTGIRLSTYATITGGLINSGVITGDNYSIYVSPDSSLDQIVISGRNTAIFNGEVYAPNTAVTIAGESAYTLGANFRVNSFSNQGLMVLNAPNFGSNYSISGGGALDTFVQSSSGVLRTNVSSANNFGSLYVDGGIILDSNSTIDVRLSGSGTGVTAGSILSGVVTAYDGIVSSGINVTDNSVLLNFNSNITGGQLNLTAAPSGACAGTISGDSTGPCLVGFDSPSLLVDSGISISGASAGVQVLAGYSNDPIAGFGINNQQGAITGTQYGIRMLSGSTLSGGITNSGSIIGGDAGIILNSATLLGAIQNTGDATISGSLGRGIVIDAYSSVAGIVNSGAYIGGIQNAGNIITNDDAINVSNAGVIDGGITNSGTIVGILGAGIRLNSGSSIIGGIQNSGSIAGVYSGISIFDSSIAGRVVNSGTISALSGYGNGAVVLVGSTLNGDIYNTGRIESLNAGVLAIGSQINGGISNAGLINGAGKVGVMLSSRSSMSGGILNAGTIRGNSTGIQIRESEVLGGIVNSGLIQGGEKGILVEAYADISTSNQVYIGNSLVSGGIVNSGTIIGGTDGIRIDGYQYTTRSIVAIAISTVTGGILNSGSIAATDTGIQISTNSLVFGGVTNSGTITAGSTAIRIYQSQISGGITNSGYLLGEESGLRVSASTVYGSIINSGSIYGVTDVALNIGGSSVIGGINNSGLISGYSGLAIGSSTIEGGITNAGLIMSDRYGGLSLYQSLINGGVTNTGSIVSSSLVAMRLEGAIVNDGIHNSGLTNGSSIGLAINGSAWANSTNSLALDSVVYGGITNSGSIIGVTVAGISLSPASASSGTRSAHAYAMVDGAVVNSGLIVGNAGVLLHSSAIFGGITNSGMIAGLGGVAIAVTGSSPTLGVHNQTAGTIVGAVNGSVNLINDGLFALQTLSGVGGTIVGGSVAHSTIVGNFTQGNTGSLQIGVSGIDGSGTTSGSYSTLSVSGTADISGIIQVSMSRNDSVIAGGTLSGILSADSGLFLGSLSVEDNSTLISFGYEQLGSSLNLTAFTDVTSCTTVSSSILGPCQIGIDSPSIVITNLGAITGAGVGIEALSGLLEGNIQNAGLVSGSQYGIKLLSNAILAGGITNSGTISGGDTGIKLAAAQVSGGIINSGSIYGSENGIFIASGSTVTGGIFNSGVISSRFGGETDSDLGAINIRNSNVLGGITNTGLITLTNQGIALEESTLAGGITNSGTIISGTWAGISLNTSSLSGGILNTGSIYGWLGISLDYSSVSGGISNAGTIIAFSAPGVDLENSTIHDGINNSGLINGVDDFGLSLSQAIVNGGMINSGSISGQGTGINIRSSSQLTGGLTNSGVISGSNNSILVSVDSVLDRIVIEGRNTAVFNGQVNARHTPVTIAGEAAYQLSANFIVDGFSNEGVLAVNPAGPGSSYSITGSGGVVPNYTQSQNGIYRVNVAGITSGEYGSMGVSGSASFDSGSTIDIRLSGANTSVSGGTTLAGVLIADGGITLGGALNVTDNSVFLDFSGSVSGGNQFNVFASTVSACAGTVSVDTTGPCLVGFDSPSLQVNTGVTITSATTGVKVLAGMSDGASVSGFGINNQGAIIGEDYGIQLLSGSTLTGGLTNSGVISGGSSGVGVYIYDAALYGGIQNTGSINSVSLEYSTLTGGIVNSAAINGAGKVGSGIGLFTSNLSGGIYNSGQIDASYAGIFSYHSTVSGGITNSGTIFAQYNGIRASSSNIAGGILNSGLIDSDDIGLAIDGSTIVGSVMNSGTINGAGKVGIQVIGSNLQNGLTNAGFISGPSSGVFIVFSTIGGGLLNSGSIHSDIGGASSTYGAAGISIQNSMISGGITNSGYISASELGILVTASTISGGITNSGTISSAFNYGVEIDESHINGSVLNTGKISGTRGIRIDSSTIIGAVNNSGSIYSDASSMYITESVITEGISNSGFMQGSYYPGGIYIESSTISGGIANSGIITTGPDGYTESGYASLQIYSSSINGGITNSGTIAGYRQGVYVSSSNVVGGIANIGLIHSDGYEGIFVGRSEIDSIDNGGSISANTGIRVVSSEISGAIQNSGTITANSVGVLVNSSEVVGGIYNTGLIQSSSTGLVLSNANIAGRMANIGTIFGADSGVLVIGSTIAEFDNSGKINGAGKIGLTSAFSTITGYIQNQAGASISGATVGIKVLGSELVGGLVNSGFVGGDSNGVGIELAYSNISGELRNEVGASIDGGQIGIVLGGSSISGGIANAGLIQGQSLAGIAVFDSFIGGGIFNQTGGTITGPSGFGVLISSGSLVEGVINDGAYIAGISNSGTLAGTPFAISVANAGTIEGGIYNSGVIYGASNGINIAANSRVSGGITNSGFISGSNYSVYVAPNSTLDRLLITGYESAAFEGEVNVRNTPVTVAGGASFNLSDHFTVNSFSNEGILMVDPGSTKTISGSNSLGGAVYAPYYQSSNATYRVAVQGTSPGDYGSMSVYGSAIFGAGSGVDVRVSGTSAGLIAGSTISSVLYADAGVTHSGTFAVTDNSVYLNFAAVLSGGNTQIDLVASSATGICAGTVSGDVSGPCLVGFDSPSLAINSGATITSATSGVQVLSGYSDGVSVSGFGIQNHGAITGNNYGIQFQSGAYLAGGLTNTGLIQGDNAGIIFNHASLSGDIHNSGTIVGSVGVQLASSNLSNSITNSGMIAGLNGVAVSVSGFSTAINIQNESTGTIVGAINGAANVNNSGLFALQSISGVGGTIVGGSVVSSSLTGTYIQDGGGTLRIGVNGNSGSGTIAGNYSTLSVDGSATLSGIINVSMSADDAVLVGGTLAGVLYASSGFQLLSPLAVTDNSALVDFEYTSIGDSNALDLVAISSVSGCGTVTSSISGPCQVAFDAPNIEVNNLGTISGAAKGIQVLSGQINGRILNAGMVSGTQYGVSFNPGATLAGGITNTGTIEGGSAGILINRSTVVGAIVNAGSIAGGNWGIATAYSQLDSGVTNTGTINALYGVRYSFSTVTGSLTNSGLISSGNKGVLINDSLVNGSINNSGTIVGIDSGILIGASTITGGIQNSGALSGITGAGVSLQIDSAISSGFINTGTVSGNEGVVLVGGNLDGGITNAGFISGSVSGISLSAYASVYSDSSGNYFTNSRNASISGGMLNQGTITATSGAAIVIKGAFASSGGVTAVGYAEVTGGLTNGGRIAGQSAIAVSRANLSGGITNTGSLIGSQVAISVTNAGLINGTITNSGFIAGNTAIAVAASTITGSLYNSGTIAGTVSGITLNASTITGAINNSGLIAGGGNAAIAVGASAISGGINNSGVISGFAGPAIQIGGSSTTVEIQNTGTIIGAINGAANVSNTGLYALQTISGVGGTIVGGSVAHSTIAGNFTQGANGTLQIGVNGSAGSGTLSGNYSTLIVGGTANLAGTVNVNMSAADTVTLGGTLSGVVSAGSGLTVSGLSITDNSALIGFEYGTTSGALNLVAVQEVSFANAVEQNNNPAAVPASNVLQSLSTNTPVAMQGVINKLYSLPTTLAVSNAISQTLPAMVGAASQASAQSQQNFNQIMQGRQNQLRGLSSGEEYIGSKDVWFKGFGSWANQDAVNNVSGYKVNTGGVAIGIDKDLSPRSNIGAVFAFGNSGMSSSNSAAGSGVTINSYQLGVYGDIYVHPDVQVNYQIDGAFNNNKAYRNLSAFNGVPGVATSSKGVNANGSYNSTSAHIGSGIKKFLYLSEDTTFIPSVRGDYTSVQSKGYTETGAGSLNMTVNSQTYNMLVTSADLRLDHQFTDKFRASVNVGAGYNILNNQVQVTSAYQGGGAAFTTKGLQVSPWQYNAGLGLTGRIQKDVEVNVRYDTQFTTTGYSNQMVSGKVKFFF